MQTSSTYTPGLVELVRTWSGACRSLISGPVSISARNAVVSSSPWQKWRLHDHPIGSACRRGEPKRASGRSMLIPAASASWRSVSRCTLGSEKRSPTLSGSFTL
eukprot:3688653-Pyramimonas_sp.AAC.1